MAKRDRAHGWRVFTAGVTVLALASLALAQQAARPLHEDVPSPVGTMLGSGTNADDTNPDALSVGDKLLPEPSPTEPPSRDEPVFGQGGFGADRNTEAQLDRNTAADGTLHYVSVFNPDVVPFKRMSALNSVDADFTMVVAPSALQVVEVGGKMVATRDRFWATLSLALRPGQRVAIPSVAPDMRVLSYEASPNVRLRFEKDSADNFYVSAPNLPRPVEVRLVMSVDADAGYFAPSFPEGAAWTPNLVRKLAPPGAIHPLPEAVAREARRALAELELDGDMPLTTTFNALVAYHRAFEAGAAPPDSGNTYRDLFAAQVGVCRHRSFVFMITANALGIPTRYVTNEAHAFVEVWFPKRGWQRVNLGGAALNLEVSNGTDKTIHRPRAEDPFTQPDAYRDNYTQLQGDIRGLSSRQLQERRDNEVASGADLAGDLAEPEGPVSSTATTPPRSLAWSDRPIDPRKQTPRLHLEPLPTAPVYRNDELWLRGSLSDEQGNPLSGRSVALYAIPAGGSVEQGHYLGATITEQGQFSYRVRLPPTLALGRYQLHAVSGEDPRFNASMSP